MHSVFTVYKANLLNYMCAVLWVDEKRCRLDFMLYMRSTSCLLCSRIWMSGCGWVQRCSSCTWEILLVAIVMQIWSRSSIMMCVWGCDPAQHTLHLCLLLKSMLECNGKHSSISCSCKIHIVRKWHFVVWLYTRARSVDSNLPNA